MSPPSDAISCSECADRLEAWLDGELTPAETTVLEDHLRRCRPCASSASHARETLLELRDLPQLEPPTAVLARVTAATQGRPVTRAPRPHWSRRPASLAAAAVLVAAVSGVLLTRSAPAPDATGIEKATREVHYALGVIAHANRAAGREIGNTLNEGLPARRAAAELGRVLERARPNGSNELDIHGG